MPTPESELFKSQKPKVAPTFNGVDYDDTKAFKQAEDAIIREQWVDAMKTRLVGEELGKCYMREGVNHLENCGQLREKYLQLLATNKVKGTKFLQQNYIDKKDEELDLAAKVHTSDKIARLNQAATMLCIRCCRAAISRRQILPLARQFSASAQTRTAEPKLSTPVTSASDAAGAATKPAVPRSICPEGTVLSGLNFTKGGQDPVAMKDEEYPEWLWSCLDVMKSSADAADENAGDEFSKSKKQRRLAAKRQKTLEAKLLAEGNLEALAPKVPLQHQSVNLPGEVGGSVQQNIEAADKREELRKAMRKERKAKIKEANYLKSM
ncbi:plasmid p 4b orf-3 family protein [Purpureocillium lavendulum]|uniref:Large ribosomal subunit protein mL54 n=1 Tax=Purpureocillium lavendulum TaxID=1247861 RepID=A0AB34G6T1_9HYPO|nr:plasmid p 4b orf-3 family protein [Purpureocillium lavendulum]